MAQGRPAYASSVTRPGGSAGWGYAQGTALLTDGRPMANETLSINMCITTAKQVGAGAGKRCVCTDSFA